MHYRIYLLAADGHIRAARDVDCATDTAAFATIAGLIDGYPAAELWCGNRRIGQWDPVEIEGDAAPWMADGPALQ